MKKIAVFTSGGDAPGMNAAIRAVVRGAIYHNLEVYGIMKGYQGMIDNDIHQMDSFSVSNILQRGGTILKSARCDDFRTPEGRQKAYDNLQKHGIDGLVAIGGDGSFTGANIFYKEFGVPVIGVPGTIDNDIFGSDQTIGFDTAVNTALDAIDKIRDTADSHGRIFFVEVMGRDSGYIAIQSAIGGGAESVILPEKRATPDDVVRHLMNKREKTFSVVVVSEKEVSGNSIVLAEKVKESFPDRDIRVSILGHMQRGATPSSQDRTLASRLGLAAVEALIEGKKDMMVGIISNQLAHTSFTDSISHPKPIDEDLIRTMKILSI